MRVLITGAAGFIGSHLADRLRELRHIVVGVDNLTTGRLENFPDCQILDICDRHELYGVANAFHPDLIIHAAASYSDPDLWHRDIDTNTAGAVNVANVARHHGARVVYFQTVLPPTSSYAISKIAAEQYLRLALSDVLLVVRLANIYGPRNLSGPIPAFTRRLLAGERCTVADTIRDFVYIDTLVDTVLERVEFGGANEMTIYSGRKTPIAGLYELVAKILDCGGQPVYATSLDDETELTFDGTPTLDCSLEFGIRETVAWYREHEIVETYTHLRVGG